MEGLASACGCVAVLLFKLKTASHFNLNKMTTRCYDTNIFSLEKGDKIFVS